MISKVQVLEDSIRNTLGSVVWSHKIHEKEADLILWKYKILEIVKIISNSLTSVGIISLIFSDIFWIKLVTSFVSFIAIFISAFFKSFTLQKMVGIQSVTAKKLLEIREELKLLILELRTGKIEFETASDDYRKIVVRLNEIYKDSPRTSDKAVEKARIALNISKDNEITDKEVDLSLPKLLRKGITDE